MQSFPQAEQQFEQHIRGNAYPGRGLVIGRSDSEAAWLQIYWIMGRSASSQNRRFVARDGTLRTEPIAAPANADLSLLIYEAHAGAAGSVPGQQWRPDSHPVRCLGCR